MSCHPSLTKVQNNLDPNLSSELNILMMSTKTEFVHQDKGEPRVSALKTPERAGPPRNMSHLKGGGKVIAGCWVSWENSWPSTEPYLPPEESRPLHIAPPILFKKHSNWVTPSYCKLFSVYPPPFLMFQSQHLLPPCLSNPYKVKPLRSLSSGKSGSICSGLGPSEDRNQEFEIAWACLVLCILAVSMHLRVGGLEISKTKSNWVHECDKCNKAQSFLIVMQLI